MAFAFFRRRQKMVIVVMAVLMVGFLIGAQGFRMLTERRPEQRVLGDTSMGELKARELTQASNDIRLLSTYARLGDVERLATTGWTMDVEFLTLFLSSPPDLVYALLLKEAAEAGYRASDAEIDAFFGQIGSPPGSANYRMMVSIMTSRNDGAAKHLRAAVGRWLMIHKSFTASRVEAPPSEQELRRLYRDLTEKIDLRLATISTEQLLEDAPQPSDEEIKQQFDAANEIFPGQYTDENPFGFGYRRPDQVRLLYLFVNRQAVSRATRPSDKEVRDHFRANRQKYLNRPSATTQPKAAPSTPPKQFSDFKDEILAELQAEAVERKMELLLSRAESLLVEFEQQGIEGQNPYQWAQAQMTGPADKPLQRKLEVVEIANEPLDRAMEILAQAAQLQAICYPYGQQGESVLDPDVKVSLSGRDITLADALAEIDRQVKSPPIKWVTFDLFEDVIFPGEDSGLQLITVGQTGSLSRGDSFEDDLLAYSATPSGQRLSQMAFLLDDFAEVNQTPSLVKVNQDAPRMVVSGPSEGMMLWRVAEAVPAYAPESVDDSLDLKAQVVQDIRTREAFHLASTKAQQLLAEAAKDGLEAAAAGAKIETTTTGMFTRKSLISPRQQAGMMAMFRGSNRQQAITQAIVVKPVEFIWSGVPAVAMPTSQSRQSLVNEVFRLVPKDVEPAAGDQPYPQKPYSLAVIKLPTRKEVLVVQRIDYSPAVTAEYDESGRKSIYQALAALNQWKILQGWFNVEGIIKRVNYQKKES